ncbi:MAG: hypothetical protein [Caudovirales sp. ctOwN3]|nr:MAG: hypothetical protein [Caudovirales sp. ctOwN3]
MAYAMTFSSLQVDLRRYLERGFTLADDPYVYEQLPRLINMAERRIARDLKVQGFISVVTTNFTNGVATYQKPDRWRDTISITVKSGNTLSPVFTRSYEYCRNYWPDATQTGKPEFYADYDYTHWLIVPTPNATYQAEILYYQLPELLDDTHQTNWLTEYAPNLLLYGALLEATPFLKNDERITTWQNFYQSAANALNQEDLKKILDRDATRTEA